MAIKESLPRKIYVYTSTVFLIILCTVMVLPLLKVVAESLSAKQFLETNSVLFWPKGFNIKAYEAVFSDPGISRAFLNSSFILITSTSLSLFMTSLFAYPLSRDEFIGKKYLLLMVTFTMIFTPPLIPQYLLIKSLGIDNTLWAVIFPGAISGFNFFVMRSFFRNIPGELIDASRIDGCTEMQILCRVVLPLSKAALASIGLFYGVSSWNALQAPLIYLRKPILHTLQIKLYSVLQTSNLNTPEVSIAVFAPETIRTATIVIATIPILAIYPFLQKYFIKGTTLGSVKE